MGWQEEAQEELEEVQEELEGVQEEQVWYLGLVGLVD